MNTKQSPKDQQCQRLIDSMASRMDQAVGDDLYEKAYMEILIYGAVLPDTQQEIQRRMESAVFVH